jgi:hypothetical protein
LVADRKHPTNQTSSLSYTVTIARNGIRDRAGNPADSSYRSRSFTGGHGVKGKGASLLWLRQTLDGAALLVLSKR